MYVLENEPKSAALNDLIADSLRHVLTANSASNQF